MGPAGWVFEFDALFEVLFALITFGIGFFSMKIYSISKQRQLKNFGLSFLSISFSYVVLALLNFGIVDLLTKIIRLNPEGLMRLILASHMALYIIGVITLAYMTLKLKSDTTYYILLILTFVSIIAAAQKLFLLYLISSLLFAYIFLYYLKNYKRKKKLRNLLVVIGFAFLLLANISLVFSVGNSAFYVSGHVLALIGYTLLFINLARIMFK